VKPKKVGGILSKTPFTQSRNLDGKIGVSKSNTIKWPKIHKPISLNSLSIFVYKNSRAKIMCEGSQVESQGHHSKK